MNRQAICSWDKDFDRFPGLKRVEPDEVAWRFIPIGR